MNESGIDPHIARQSGGLTIDDLFRQSVATFPNAVALANRTRAIRYAELNERVNRLVQALASKGVAAGDRVAVLSENRLEYVELELAAAKLGAILACQNWRQADAELSPHRTVGPKLIFVSERYVRLLPVLAAT